MRAGTGAIAPRRHFSIKGLFLFPAVFIIFMLIAPAPAGAWLRGMPNRQVLVIYSYMRSLPWQSRVMEGLDRGLSRLDGYRIPFIFEENLDASRILKGPDDPSWRDYLLEKYADARIDAVITDGHPAAAFLLRNPDLFPEAERYLFNFVPDPAFAPGRGDEVRFEAVSDFDRSLRLIKEILPDTNRIVVVTDKSELGLARTKQIHDLEESLSGIFSLEVYNDFTADELYLRASKLAKGTVLFYLPVTMDRNGDMLIPGYVGETLSRTASVPVFTHYDSLIGRGIVGGYVTSGVLLGELMARIAGEGLTAIPHDIEQYRKGVIGHSYDARALKRWGIPLRSLPAGSEILYHERSFWERYWPQLIFLLFVFILQSLLTLALLRASIQRKRALLLLEKERNALESRVEERTRALTGINLELTREVAERRKAEEGARQLVEEKTTLFKELQHRVKNSMTIITSLVGLESLKVESEDARLILEKLQSRINALASLYEILYTAGGVDHVDLKAYLERIVDAACESLGTDLRHIEVESDIVSRSIDLKPAVSLGLIVNELVTDALKHAFVGREAGQLAVRVREEGAMLLLDVSDDGVGLPAGFTLEDSQGFGFQLIGLLVQQLKAEFSHAQASFAQRGPGTSFVISIPLSVV